VRFVGLCCVIMSQCTVHKALKISKSCIHFNLQVILLGTYLAGHEMNFYWILNFRLLVIVRVLHCVIVVTTIVTLTLAIISLLGRNLC